jgi:exonuclease-1
MRANQPFELLTPCPPPPPPPHQLTFLNLRGYVAGIITEDTDMIAFGARTILFKMDKEGYGDEYRQKVLGACENMRLSAWEPERVTQMCIFAGCDYLKSINSMGIMK